MNEKKIYERKTKHSENDRRPKKIDERKKQMNKKNSITK